MNDGQSHSGVFDVVAAYFSGAFDALFTAQPPLGNLGPWAFNSGTGFGVARVWFAVYLGAFIVVTGLGVVVGYHRMLTHRAVRFPVWMERGLVLAGIYAGTPVQWVGNHRFHHGVTDLERDPHSPTVHGFWTAHAGWYLETARVLPAIAYTFAGPFRTLFDAFWRPRTNQQHAHLAPDVARDPFLATLSRPLPYAVVLLLSAAIQIGVVVAAWGAGFALVFLSMVTAFYAFGDLVNSLGHAHRSGFALGTAPFASNDASRNSRWLAVVTFGDGFHNGHHAFPFSARAGLLRGEIDVAWWFIAACSKCGLAHDVKLPTPEQLRAKMRPQEDRQ